MTVDGFVTCLCADIVTGLPFQDNRDMGCTFHTADNVRLFHMPPFSYASFFVVYHCLKLNTWFKLHHPPGLNRDLLACLKVSALALCTLPDQERPKASQLNCLALCQGLLEHGYDQIHCFSCLCMGQPCFSLYCPD